MNITIIGWYGTETIGDRGILAGILSILFRHIDVREVFLGSLFPFFTEKTIIEDRSFWKKIMSFDPNLSIFDSTKPREIEHHISRSDIVLIGGGPLMHIDPMYMLAYAFKYAKKIGKKTIVFGSGVGPIFTRKHKVVLTQIFNYSDKIILRDSISLANARNIYNELGKSLDENKISVSLDPALESCLKYKNKCGSKTSHVHHEATTAAVSLRNFPAEYLKRKSDLNLINDRLGLFYKKLISSYDQVNLIPMHYFVVGGDDREYLNKLYFERPNENVHVQNVPLSLEETMKVFSSADICYGMRFHSVIFQTILNGSNYTIDYTEPRKGKISGFIEDLKCPQGRYVNIQENDIPDSFFEHNQERFHVDESALDKKLGVYDIVLRELM